MASFNFEDATLRMTFETGLNEFGEPLYSTKTYRNVRANVIADQVGSVAQALASLSNYPLKEVKKTETETVEL